MEAGGVGEVRVHPDPEALADDAAVEIADAVRAAVEARGRAHLVLAGGGTPAGAYRRLAAAPSTAPWERVEFLFGDERCVPLEDAASNYRMARESLLTPLGVDPVRVHRMRGELPPPEAAEMYERELRGVLGEGRPDLVLLGLGEDGHTASLFPGSPALLERERWVLPTEAPVEPRLRITMALPILNRARRVLFLVSGAAKAGAVRRVLARDEAPEPPARLVRPPHGSCLWLLDRAAAA